MKNRRTRIGLSILTGSLSFVGAAQRDGPDHQRQFRKPCRARVEISMTPTPRTTTRDQPSQPRKALAPHILGITTALLSLTKNFVTPTNLTDHLQYNLQWANSQTVNLTNAITPAGIDAGLGRFTFSSWLASYGQPVAIPNSPSWCFVSLIPLARTSSELRRFSTARPTPTRWSMPTALLPSRTTFLRTTT